MLTRRQSFNAEADAIYRQRKREAYWSLKPGDRITCWVQGDRVVATVRTHMGPDLLVVVDGVEHLIAQQAFGARRIG